jgi:hypothetical protein
VGSGAPGGPIGEVFRPPSHRPLTDTDRGREQPFGNQLVDGGPGKPGLFNHFGKPQEHFFSPSLEAEFGFTEIFVGKIGLLWNIAEND